MKHVLFIILGFATGAQAQTILTFEQVVQRTMENNFDIQIVRNTAEQVANNNNAGNAGYLPTVNVTADQYWSSYNTRQELYSGEVKEKNGAKTSSLSAAVRLDWTFFDGFAMFAADKRLQLQEDQATLQVSAQVEMTVYQAAVLYYSLVYQGQMTEVYKDALELSRERYNLATLKKNNGAANDLEWIQARLDMNTDSSNLLMQLKTIRDLKQELATVMGNSSDTQFEVVKEVPLEATIDRTSIAVKAQEQNTSILYSKASIAIIDAQRKEMQGRYYPQLGLYGQYVLNNSHSQVGVLSSNQSTGPGVGLTLRWSILDRLSTFTELKNNDLQKESAELNVTKQEQLMTKQLQDAFADYDYANQLYQLENAAIVNTEELFAITKLAYDNGSLTTLELREIQFSVVQARNRQLSSALALQTAKLNLSLISGDYKGVL